MRRQAPPPVGRAAPRSGAQIRSICAAAALLAGCSQVLGIDELSGPGGGGGSDAGPRDAPSGDGPDAPTGPSITLTGIVIAYPTSGQPQQPLRNVQLAFVLAATGAQVANATTDNAGAFALTVPTQGMPVDGVITASLPSFAVTRHFLFGPVRGDVNKLEVWMLDANRIQQFAGQCSPVTPNPQHTVLMIVVDATNQPLSGVQVRTAPPSPTYCYSDNRGEPGPVGKTQADGIAWAFGLPFGQPIEAQAELPGAPARILPPAAMTTLSIAPVRAL
jgi:hypothetical protein